MARKLPNGPWRFYVYEIGDHGAPAYIGKGSGHRLRAQKKNFARDGREVARFFNEKQAYQFERELIAEFKPALNKSPGGSGSMTTPPRPYRKTKEEREMDQIGTRVYVARLLMKYEPFLAQYGIDVSKVEQIRQVAYGSGA